MILAKDTLDRVIDLQRLMIEFYKIDRELLLPGTKDANETVVGHSYSLALVAWYLTQNLPQLDSSKCIRYAMVHDLLEIHAGDTFAYDKNSEVLNSKLEREANAVKQLKQDWPDFHEMTEYIEGYEGKKDAESRFVFALDKFMPIVINYLSKGRGWKKHGIKLSDVKKEKQSKISVSPEVETLYNELISALQSKPEFFPAKESNS